MTVVLLRIGHRQLEVNQFLRQRANFFETSGGGYYFQKKTEANERRDSLIHRYETAPSVAKVRRYVLSTLLFAAGSGLAGFASGGEMKIVEEEEEDDGGLG